MPVLIVCISCGADCLDAPGDVCRKCLENDEQDAAIVDKDEVAA